MNLNSTCLDGQRVLYILTLGVLEGARQKGIGSALLRLILNEVRITWYNIIKCTS
jgi:ribosomal protein S18 acetylase RimI-like enzyme